VGQRSLKTLYPRPRTRTVRFAMLSAGLWLCPSGKRWSTAGIQTWIGGWAINLRKSARYDRDSGAWKSSLVLLTQTYRISPGHRSPLRRYDSIGEVHHNYLNNHTSSALPSNGFSPVNNTGGLFVGPFSLPPSSVRADGGGFPEGIDRRISISSTPPPDDSRGRRYCRPHR
jgi:hypothetical protein